MTTAFVFALPSLCLRSSFVHPIVKKRTKNVGRAKEERKHDELIQKKKAYTNVSLDVCF